ALHLTPRLPPPPPPLPYTTLFRSLSRYWAMALAPASFRPAAQPDRHSNSSAGARPALVFLSSQPAATAFSWRRQPATASIPRPKIGRHTSELQSPDHLVCRLLLEN